MASPNVFSSAYQRFLSTLSDADRLRYDDKCTPQGLLDGLKKISSLAKGTQTRRSQKPFAILRDFNERMRPFFAIIEGPVTQSSVYAGAALGALRLVLELASCFPTLLTKLLGCIEEITESFPRYENLEDICRGKLTPRLTLHLGRVYRDLFDFFDSAASLFTAGNGKVRRPVELIASVIWRPFDERFGGILSSMSKHQQQLNDEINIYQLELTTDVTKTSEELFKDTQATRASVSGLQEQMRLQTREQAIAKIQSWLNAPNFASTYWDTLDECQEDTAQWIFEVDKFQEWSESTSRSLAGSSAPDSGLLWIYGNPGGGKSVLTASIVRELSTYNQNLVCFFFREQSPFHTASDLAFRAILAQILHKHKHDDDILDKFIFASNHSDKSSGQSIATPAELRDLLHLCLSAIESPVMVLDGIDECTEPDEFVKHLKPLISIPNLRVLFSSRPTVQSLTKLVPIQYRLNFGQVGVEHDIHIYCHYHMTDLVDDGLLSDSSDIQYLTRRMVLGADRMFLWAKLMLSFLRSPALNGRSRENLIHSITLPEGLGSIYMRIFRQISLLDSAQQHMAKKVIQLTLLCSQECFLSSKAWLHLLSAEEPDDQQSAFAHLSELISLVTCGLVICRGSQLRLGIVDASSSGGSHSANCVFVHLSVREYLLEWTPEDQTIAMLSPPPIISHMDMAKLCLDHLLDSAPTSIPLSMDRGLIDLYSYCSVRWLYHLGKVVSPWILWRSACCQELCSAAVTGIIDLLRRLLENPLAVAHWIDCFYTSPSVCPLWSPAGVGLFRFDSDNNVPTGMILKEFSQAVEWLDWAQQLHVPDISSKIFLDLSDNLLRLRDDLADLCKKWELKLNETPAIIWSDVLAFTSSKYLPAAQLTYQVPISSGTPSLPARAFKRLCHISATSSDGSVLGILNIWPSRKFEEFWETIHPSSAYMEVENYCEGWHAVYELSRVGEPMEILGTVSIPFQATEVLLQIRQAFRQEHFSTWKASFPFAISANGYSLCVLRTIYHVTIDPVLSRLRIRSCRMPLEEITRIQHFWDDRLETHDPSYALSIGLPPTLQLLSRKVYTYRTIFDHQGRYVFFQDAKKFEAPLLAVFEMNDTSTGELQVRVVAVAPEEIMSSWLGCTGVPLATARFHPQSTLIVSAIRGRVMAWDFSRNTMNHLSTDGAEVTSLSISTCANYVVVMRKYSDSHEVYDLRERNLNLANRTNNSLGGSESLMPPHKQRKTHSSHEDCMEKLDSRMEAQNANASGSTLALAGGAGNSTIVNSGPQDTGFQLRIDAGRIKLTAPPSIGQATSRSLELLSIPNSLASRDSRITLYLPRQDENNLSILVDKGIEDGYDMLEESGQSLPVLVRKDKRLIHQAIQKAVGDGDEGIKLVEGTKRLFSDVDQ